MHDRERDGSSKSMSRATHQDEPERTPGSKGYPEPGSGHDESQTVTVEDGPPIEKTDGVPGAFGDVGTGDREP